MEKFEAVQAKKWSKILTSYPNFEWKKKETKTDFLQVRNCLSLIRAVKQTAFKTVPLNENDLTYLFLEIRSLHE